MGVLFIWRFLSVAASDCRLFFPGELTDELGHDDHACWSLLVAGSCEKGQALALFQPAI